MTILFGRVGILSDETNGTDGNGTAGGAAGAAAGAGAGDGVATDTGGGQDGVDDGQVLGEGGDKKEVETPKDMLSAIDAGLGYKKDAEGFRLDATGKRTHNPDGSEIKEAKPDAGAAGKESETHHANGKPKKNAAGQDLDADGKFVKKPDAKVKTSAELELKADQLKLLKPEAQQRFREVIGALKTHEATIAKQNELVGELRGGRDAILGVMKETNTTSDQLSGYLYFNQLLQSSDPKDLETALGMIEQQRLGLYQALGREPEGGGVDLLKGFPDLQKQVEEEEITRTAALEIAKARRDKASREAHQTRSRQHQDSQRQTAKQQQEAGDKAMKGIEEWTAGLAKSDLDYKAKEDKLLAKLDGVLKDYPVHQWLPTLKLLYEGIEITKAPAAGGRQQQPLRPSGARPGAKAPTDMLDAINQGLGYAQASKD